MLSYFHRWLYKLLYSKSFAVSPYTSCFMRKGLPDYDLPLVKRDNGNVYMRGTATAAITQYIKNENYDDIGSFPMGCVSAKDTCAQSDGVHQAMKIYDAKKNNERMTSAGDVNVNYAYPMVYFRSYMLNPSDPRIANFFDTNIPGTNADLVLNALPQELDILYGCGNMIVSQNYAYFLVLDSRRLVIYQNVVGKRILELCVGGVPPSAYGTPVNTVTFAGGVDTHMVIEETVLNIRSKVSENAEDKVVYSITVCEKTSATPVALVLKDDGSLAVFDVDSKDITAPGLKTLNNNAVLSTGDVGGPFDKDADYRQRILNLIAYLRMRSMYTETSTPVMASTSKSPADSGGIAYPPYDAQMDYVGRYNSLIQEYRARNLLSPSDPYAQMLGINTPLDESVPAALPDTPATSLPASSSNSTNTPIPVDDVAKQVEADRKKADDAAKKRKDDDAKRLEREMSMNSSGDSASLSNPGAQPTIAPTIAPTTPDCELDAEERAYVSSGTYNADMDQRVRLRNLCSSISARSQS